MGLKNDVIRRQNLCHRQQRGAELQENGRGKRGRCPPCIPPLARHLLALMAMLAGVAGPAFQDRWSLLFFSSRNSVGHPIIVLSIERSTENYSDMSAAQKSVWTGIAYSLADRETDFRLGNIHRTLPKIYARIWSVAQTKFLHC